MNWFRKTIFSSRFWVSGNKFSSDRSSLTATVVIPAWNEQDFIADTIRSIQNSSYPVEIIVANDNSTDRTSEIAKSFQGVRVIDIATNQGSKSKALNFAIPYIDTDIFICVDADTTLEANSIDKIMKAFNNENVYVASGFVVASGGNFWQAGRRGDYLAGQHVCKSAQENSNCVLVASGCFFAIRFDYLKTHNFNERTLAEDMDLTWQAIEDGYDVAFVQDAFCYVVDPDSWYLYDKQMSRWFCGFFQNIKQRNFNLFSKNPKLGIVVYAYLLLSLVGVPAMLTALIIYPLNSISFLAIGYLLLAVTSMYSGIKHDTLSNVIFYPYYIIMLFAIGIINYYIFIKCMYREFFTKNTLTTWVKGH